MLRILGRTSSINVRKVLWVCEELGIAHSREDWGSGFRPTREAEFLKLNPRALIPVVIDGDTILTESNAICRYLATRYGNGALLPEDPVKRAEVEAWMDWMIADLNGSWRYAVQALVRKRPGFDNPAEIQRSISEWNGLMAVFDAQLETAGDCLCGAFSLADIVMGLAAHRWQQAPIARVSLPRVTRYAEGLRRRPAAARFMGPDFD
ncbi:MAG: glutathione S-transferase family protein [Rhabdaerophilum sp.]